MTISGAAVLAGVMGYPVAHSLSPLLHGTWITRHGLDAAYVPLSVRPQDFAQALRALPKLGFRGANITIPHKEAALSLVTSLDATAALIGAVNTIVIEQNGAIHGLNTDSFGYAESLRCHGVDLGKLDGVLLIGAGGAARAVIHACASSGTKNIAIMNRTRSRAEDIAKTLSSDMHTPLKVIDWDTPHPLQGMALVINTTALGMSGHPPLELDWRGAEPTLVASDIVYRPLETRFLKSARDRGLRTIDGLDMLMHQARAGFHAWFGVDPSVDEQLRAKLMSVLGTPG